MVSLVLLSLCFLTRLWPSFTAAQPSVVKQSAEYAYSACACFVLGSLEALTISILQIPLFLADAICWSLGHCVLDLCIAGKNESFTSSSFALKLL
jgi:hypothetical protein